MPDKVLIIVTALGTAAAAGYIVFKHLRSGPPSRRGRSNDSTIQWGRLVGW
jgi:hypothetical protein